MVAAIVVELGDGRDRGLSTLMLMVRKRSSRNLGRENWIKFRWWTASWPNLISTSVVSQSPVCTPLPSENSVWF